MTRQRTPQAPAGYLTLDEVLIRVRWSRAGLYRRIAAGEFPKARKRQGRRALWSAADVSRATAQPDRIQILFRIALGLI